jgi:hypothetical protein
MMEAGSTSETSVNFYKTTWRKIPEDSHLHTRRLENVKPYRYTSEFPKVKIIYAKFGIYQMISAKIPTVQIIYAEISHVPDICQNVLRV